MGSRFLVAPKSFLARREHWNVPWASLHWGVQPHYWNITYWRPVQQKLVRQVRSVTPNFRGLTNKYSDSWSSDRHERPFWSYTDITGNFRHVSFRAFDRRWALIQQGVIPSVALGSRHPFFRLHALLFCATFSRQIMRVFHATFLNVAFLVMRTMKLEPRRSALQQHNNEYPNHMKENLTITCQFIFITVFCISQWSYIYILSNCFIAN